MRANRDANSAPSAENWHQFVIVMAMDAFRLCLGMKPSKHSLDEVILWMQLMNKAQPMTSPGSVSIAVVEGDFRWTLT